ncbi:hypothetical protein MMC07_003668 [Pseudocyphellaria aurata]|nr:hypothetical protein [Pseudocyphellaria aurata]
MIGYWNFVFLLLLNPSYAAPAPQATVSPSTTASLPNPTVCGDIVKAGAQTSGQYLFNASTVYECLTSVPFNPAVASQFIQYYNDTLQFQSTLAFLKDPPRGYQQPPTDLMAGLARIQKAIDNGQFKDEYSFEATLQSLIYSAHDAHLQLVAGVLAPFTFALPFELASVSLDGKELPKVYDTSDLLTNETENGKLTWKPSAISKINGQDVTEYLTRFAAANSVGGLEPHADWNMLMQSPALDIQGLSEGLAGTATFYPGDTYTLTFENGTTLGPQPWLAVYDSPGDTGPLETGGDFYNFFVLGFYPASYFDELNAAEASASASASASPTAAGAATSVIPSVSPPVATSWNNLAYPDHPDVVQNDLEIVGGGYLSGYFLKDKSIAVLSIPSFDEYGEAIGTFSTTIDEFIKKSLKNGMKKVVIDVQQNSGGGVFLAIDAFKQFFPSTEPFVGSQRRVHPMANVIGDTISQFWGSLATDDEYYYDLAVDEWVILDRLSAATGKNFSSWAEYFDPAFAYKDDTFSATERYNLSSVIFDQIASGGITVYGYGDRPATSPQPYPAEDIIILTDGLCSSACAVFMEMMHHEAGVRTVVAGGRPTYGPMQSPAQSRGARLYSTDNLDAHIEYVQALNDTASALLPNRTINRDLYVSYASFNLRDQVRQDDHVPLQFQYEAANCRIFYTPKTWYNYSALWQYAADAIWSDPSLCVQGSTGYATTAAESISVVKTAPSAAQGSKSQPDLTGIISLSGTPGEFPAAFGGAHIIPDDSKRLSSVNGQSCTTTCPGNYECRPVSICSNGKKANKKQCVPTCSSLQYACTNGAQCALHDPPLRGPTGQSDFYQGLCIPTPPKFCGTHSRSGHEPPPPPVNF